MRKYSVAISKRTHAPFSPTYVVTWRASPQKTYGHLLYRWVNLNSKMKHHTFSTEPRIRMDNQERCNKKTLLVKYAPLVFYTFIARL